MQDMLVNCMPCIVRDNKLSDERDLADTGCLQTELYNEVIVQKLVSSGQELGKTRRDLREAEMSLLQAPKGTRGWPSGVFLGRLASRMGVCLSLTML
jgi:hypothetical protein